MLPRLGSTRGDSRILESLPGPLGAQRRDHPLGKTSLWGPL